MAGAPVIVLVGAMAAVVVLVAVVVAVVSAVRRPAVPADRPEPPAGSPAARCAQTHVAVVSTVGWLAAAVAGLAVLNAAASGRPVLFALAPLAAGATAVVVHVAGELTWPRPAGAVRTASLVRRGVGDVVGRGVGRWTAALAGLLVVQLVGAGLTADPSGTGWSFATADGHRGWGGSPYPGRPYGAPTLATLGVLAALTGAAVLLVVRRAAVAGTAASDDLALRRASAARLLAAVQLAVGLTTAGVGFVLAGVAHSLGRSARLDGAGTFGFRVLEVGGVVAMLAAIGLALACGGVAVVVLVRSRSTTVPAVATGSARPARVDS